LNLVDLANPESSAVTGSSNYLIARHQIDQKRRPSLTSGDIVVAGMKPGISSLSDADCFIRAINTADL